MKKRLCIWAIIIAVVLLIPLVTQWPWSPGDYIVGGVLLFGAAAVFEYATRNTTNVRRRLGIGLVVAVILLFVWAELAVGIFTNLGS